MYNPYKSQPKSVQQIVSEMMFEELLIKDRYRGNNFVSQSIKTPSKLCISKNQYRNFVSQQRNLCSANMKINGHQMEKSLISKPKNHIIQLKKLLKIDIPAKNENPKPCFYRGIANSEHFSNSKTVVLPSVNKKESQRVYGNNSLDESGQFEGYKLISEEMSLEIDEYVRMQNRKKLLPPIL